MKASSLHFKLNFHGALSAGTTATAFSAMRDPSILFRQFKSRVPGLVHRPVVRYTRLLRV